MQNLVNIEKILKILKRKKEAEKAFKFESQKFLTNSQTFSFKAQKKKCHTNTCAVRYILTIKFTKTNTLLNLTNFKGLPMFFMSAGQIPNIKKKKLSRRVIIKKLLNLMVLNLDFLKDKPLVLHLKNIDINKTWLIRFINCKFFIKTIKTFNIYPHNGCRKKKKKRKKIRTYAK